MEDDNSRRARKDEAKRLKRKVIEDAGGKRPRSVAKAKTENVTVKPKKIKKKLPTKNRFGKVMEQVPSLNKSRSSTLSIAIPGSVVSNAQTKELRTQLVGQIARAAAIYHVDEIIVFDDKLSTEINKRGGFYQNNRRRQSGDDRNKEVKTHHEEKNDEEKETSDDRKPGSKNSSDPHEFMTRVLQYCECPQYLRRYFFSMHPDLQFGGLLAPLDAPHHVRLWDKCKYREGIVLDRKGKDGGSLVNCGIRDRPVEIDRVLDAGLRCTVMLDIKVYDAPGRQIKGKVVSPTAPREDSGTYWGYTTRRASSINAIFDESPYGAYDLKIGTSERGDVTVDDKNFRLPSFKHSLIVFGGVAGIEECVDADESLSVAGDNSKSLFDIWMNICPYQASRTIRTEEAILITLSRMSPHMFQNITSSTDRNQNKLLSDEKVETVKFSDSEPSDESSDDEQ
mmetsp:Transcript_30222/g.29114  ORF Transcript_30222/g.29114 Transcript_30222/m.29114 type:complete len:451 (-) Transcript_30222:220-1572(-)|eukprot:CAMPEP_0197826592 /NCGR_PEP_ID=MMETSP1437-20131217/3534_1 /TAXON_ID=49252 ORGANISM="Eucampia antarctica, Strain CCMP1452" /NCGR_SAMPLE_ID=MMETSP1437 /ASSEMBLY_ACC=CAM_ASM_001096 /LENGTH=450 /DNA_ID=CAMNT_0043427097 /DNA_START=32 /DNA_END=1384 /DNA_ORIENTATION=+